MNDHIDRRFPGRRTAIHELALVDSAFRAALSDYEELCTWFSAHENPASRTPQEFERARRLIGELEDEILNQLEQGREHAGDTIERFTSDRG